MSGELLHPKALPPFAALRAFEAVGREGGIRKAAASLGIDHAVISRHIRQLEDWLGTPLFRRRGGRMELAEAGVRYHARVSAAFIELAAATSDLVQNENDGHLKMWCIPGFGAQWIARRLAEFEALNPAIRVEMRPTDEIADLLMREADIDVRYYGDDWPPHPGGRGLRFVELARPEVFPVASPRVAARFAKTKSAAEFVKGPLLHEEHFEQWRAWFSSNGIPVPDGLAGPRLWHAHLAVAAAKQDRGIALANSYLVQDDLARGDLVELRAPDAGPVVLGSYVFATREDRWTWRPIAKLRQYLEASL